MPKKTTKPPWVNWLRSAGGKVYVSELPPKGLPKVYYNVIGTQRWWLYNHKTREWNGNINPAYVFAEYEVAFWCSANMYDKWVKDLIAARDYIENCESPPTEQFPTGPLYFRL